MENILCKVSDDASSLLSGLRASLVYSRPVEGMIVLDLIEDAVKIKRRIDELINAQAAERE
jgi:hypothetical protein